MVNDVEKILEDIGYVEEKPQEKPKEQNQNQTRNFKEEGTRDIKTKWVRREVFD